MTIAAVLVAVMLGLAGCAQRGNYQASVTATTVGSPGGAASGTGGDRPSAADARAAILAGYRAYWDALVTAGADPDPASPLLPAHAIGIALAEAREHLAELKRLGHLDRGKVALHPRVVAIRGTTATVEDCPDTSHWLRRDAGTGALRDHTPPGRRTHVAVLYLIDDTWKVADITWKQRCGS
ncbi:MAG TPA: hypothetical protein VFA45_07690 [Actinomycetes bacterium]|nr:hypothetical protein [Actinomycetes bacterium]